MIEKEQLQSFEYVNNIINTLNEPLIVLDGKLRILSVNEYFYEFFKVKPEDTIGKLIYNLGNKQWDIPKLRELLEEILPKKNTFDDYEVEHDFTTIGRRVMLLNARKIKQAEGREDIILLAIEDITKRREIEKELERRREELEVIKISADEISLFAENLINTVREPLICLDQNLRVMSVSRSFYEFFNVKPEDTMGELIYNLGNKQWDIPKLRELLEEILPEENTFNGYEVEHNFTTIGRRVMLLNAREIIQASGKKKIILLAIEDITERKDMEKELQLTEEMMLIQSKQAAMGNMISMIAHQWRQPLTVMSMDANNLIMSIALEEELSTDYLLQFGNDLLAHIQQLSKTIDDFRDFFKPDQSKEKMIIEDVLNDTLKIIGTSLSNNNIALNIKNPSKSSLYINKSSFIQVLLNIIGNAKDILLEKEVSKATISINVNETKEVITISICDNGGGIPEAIIGKIGQPYLTTKEKLNGTGLGIYISLTIVKKHMNGTLTWHNEEQGACFVITLNKEKSIKNN